MDFDTFNQRWTLWFFSRAGTQESRTSNQPKNKKEEVKYGNTSKLD
jgi:hypothetical protein